MGNTREDCFALLLELADLIFDLIVVVGKLLLSAQRRNFFLEAPQRPVWPLHHALFST